MDRKGEEKGEDGIPLKKRRGEGNKGERGKGKINLLELNFFVYILFMAKKWKRKRKKINLLELLLVVKGGRTRPAESAPHKSWHLLRESVETERNLRRFLWVSSALISFR